MKVKFSTNVLAKLLKVVTKLIPSRPINPSFSYILVEASDDEAVYLNGFDGNSWLKLQVPDAYVEEPGSIAIASRLWDNLMSRIADDSIILTNAVGTQNVLGKPSGDSVQAVIETQAGQYRLGAIAREQFPTLPELELEFIPIPVQALLKAIGATLFAASDDQSKMILTGVNFLIEQKDSSLKLAATNGHRLAFYETQIGPVSKTTQVTLPQEPLTVLERLLAVLPDDTQVQFGVTYNQVIFETEQWTLLTRTLDGVYPDYKQLIPSKFVYEAVLPRKELSEALERLSIISVSAKNMVHLKPVPEQATTLLLESDASELGYGQEHLAAEMTEAAPPLCFNVKYLIDALKTMDAESVVFRYNSSTSPVVIEPVGDPHIHHLVMPIQIRS